MAASRPAFHSERGAPPPVQGPDFDPSERLHPYVPPFTMVVHKWNEPGIARPGEPELVTQVLSGRVATRPDGVTNPSHSIHKDRPGP